MPASKKPLVKDLLTIQECADSLGITRSAVYLAIKEERLKAIQLGRNWFVTKRDLKDYTPQEQYIEWGKNPKRT